MGTVGDLGDAQALQAILERARDAFISFDAAGTVRAWNAAAERLFGWPAAEALGRSVTALIAPPSLRHRYDEGLAHLHEHGASDLPDHRLELTVADRAGREFPIEMALQVDDRPGGPLLHAFVHDISDRREARRRLEEERTFLRALLDSLQVGVMACDGDGRLTLFNRAARELHRVPGDPPGGSDGDWPQDRNLFAPDGRTPLRPEQAPLARARAGENVDGQHLVIRPPEAEPRRCVVNGRPITTPDGRRLGAVSALHDITDQHRAQVLRDAQHAVAQALAEAVCSEQAAARVLTAVTRALDWSYGEYWQIDPDRSALVRAGAWHRPGLAFTGDPTEAVRRGQGLPGRVWATGRTVWMSDLRTEPRPFPRREALEAGLRSAIALPVRSGDQVLGVLVFCSEAVQEPDDDLVALLDGVCAHVGRFMERRRAEELALALAASRRHFDQVVSQLDDNVWTIEITPDGRARSVYQSQNAAGVFGGRVPEGADISGLLRRHVHPEDLPAYTAFDEKVNTGIPAQVECRVIGLDGAVRWIWIRSTPRREDGRLFADGISTDVTERHRLAEERDRMKDELVALVSHELRNPVGAIRGYVEMLVDTPGLTGTQRMFADVIDRTSAHLLDLVDDLLDLARLDAGHIAIDPRPVSLARLVRQAVDDHRAAAAARHLTVATDLAPHPPVHADPVRLRQVLDNLLSNAVKYTPDGGAVTVGLGGDDADRAAVVTVADTGIGVPAEEYPQLFGRFFRASTAQEAGIKGTGLGLAVTRAIVEAHGGTAAAAPREGGGTVFTVRLPAASSPPGAHGRPHPAHR